MDDVAGLTPRSRQVLVDGGAAVDVGVNIAALDDGSAAVHVVGFGYDAGTDAVPLRRDVELAVRLPFEPASATLVRPGSEPVELAVRRSADACAVTLPELGVYGVVVLRAG
jgi:hypothetical protein